jgi:hypothetical protein
VTIEDSVFREAKAEAARTGRTLGGVIEDALRAAMHRPTVEDAELPPLPTYGGSGVREGVDLSSNAAIQDLLDEGVSLDALR